MPMSFPRKGAASFAQRVVVTRKGRPAAVLLSPDDLESLEETLAVLSDPELMRLSVVTRSGPGFDSLLRRDMSASPADLANTRKNEAAGYSVSP